jgi:hypothetical protein
MNTTSMLEEVTAASLGKKIISDFMETVSSLQLS